MEENYREKQEVFSKKVKAGKRRTYFFDVKETKGSDFYLIITESKKRFDSDQYERHKIFLYKEDFNKFIKALEETVDYVKTELLPDYDFDAFEHNDYDDNGYKPSGGYVAPAAAPAFEESANEIIHDDATAEDVTTEMPEEDTQVENKTPEAPTEESQEVDPW